MTHKELRKILIAATTDDNMEGHFFYRVIDNNVHLFCWASPGPDLKLTHLVSAARLLSVFKMRMAARDEPVKSRVRISSREPYVLAVEDVANVDLSERYNHVIVLKIFCGDCYSQRGGLRIKDKTNGYKVATWYEVNAEVEVSDRKQAVEGTVRLEGE